MFYWTEESVFFYFLNFGNIADFAIISGRRDARDE
jgi:hypothetical protein